MVKLKTCPFCGGEMVMRYSSKHDEFMFYHKTAFTGCKFVTPFEVVRQVGIETLDEASKVWNKRCE